MELVGYVPMYVFRCQVCGHMETAVERPQCPNCTVT